jgi:hypothetical protein
MWNLKVKKEQQSYSYGDAIARTLADKIIVLQQRIVRILQRWDRRYSIRQKKIRLLIFCMICGSYCGYLLTDALFRKINGVTIPPVAQPPPFYRHRDSSGNGHVPEPDTSNQPLKKQ